MLQKKFMRSLETDTYFSATLIQTATGTMSSNSEPDYNYNYSYEFGNFTLDYDHNGDSENQDAVTPTCSDATCIFSALCNVIISILSIAGNGSVIWIAGFKLKRSINTTWYLSLALSDLLFCSFLPFNVVYLVKKDWIFGRSMCKFTSFVLFLNMFSSIFLLVVISVDRCVVVMFPVWAQNQRTVKKASVMVMVAWIFSAVLSTPAVIFREVKYYHDFQGNVCFNNYTPLSQEHSAVVAFRFTSGFVIPFLIIVICYAVIIRKLNTNHMARSKKPFKIMTALIVTFFVSWLPYHTVALMELEHRKYKSILTAGQQFSSTLASANSCMNPFLYAFMGKDFKKKCYALLSKIENAIEEEGRSTFQRTSITTSGEGKLSTAV